MFNLSYSTPCEVQGTIRVKKFSAIHLGGLTDEDGNCWDIRGIYGNGVDRWVTACPQHLVHPYYSDTSGQNYDQVSQTWKPYKVEETGNDG